jgi:uncharacterized protein YecE (DUF72 family)
MQIFVGTSGYSYKEWQGKFYPAKIPPKEMLHFYAQRLTLVEINNTFYHMPTEPVLISWAAQVPDSFVFALKAPRIITHLKRLKNIEDEVDYLFKTVAILDQKLGPVMFQFPSSFRANRPLLEDFLTLIPESIPCAFEFRHHSWLEAEILEMLRARNLSLCLADTDENPAEEIIATAAWGYLRLRRSSYTDVDLSQWLERIQAKTWEKAFVFFKHAEEAKGPEMALLFQKLNDARRKRIQEG